MISDELVKAMKAAFETVPTAQEVIDWAKANGFTFIKQTLGAKKSCGCAGAAVFLMRCDDPELVTEAYSMNDDVYYPDQHISELYCQTDGKLSSLYVGFDSDPKIDLKSDNEWTKFGAELQKLVTLNKMWKAN